MKNKPSSRSQIKWSKLEDIIKLFNDQYKHERAFKIKNDKTNKLSPRFLNRI